MPRRAARHCRGEAALRDRSAQRYADAQCDLGTRLLMCGEGGQQDVAEAMRLFGLAAAQGHADAQEDLTCLDLTVAAEGEVARIGGRVRARLEGLRAPSRGAARRISRGGLVDGRLTQGVLSTPTATCSPSTRGDSEHASGGRAPSAPGQISARKAARALLQECGDELED